MNEDFPYDYEYDLNKENFCGYFMQNDNGPYIYSYMIVHILVLNQIFIFLKKCCYGLRLFCFILKSMTTTLSSLLFSPSFLPDLLLYWVELYRR